jgi:hypothetical protein
MGNREQVKVREALLIPYYLLPIPNNYEAFFN